MVVVVVRELHRAQLLLVAPIGDDVLARVVVLLHMRPGQRAFGQRDVCTGRVAQHQRVLAVDMGEVVPQSFFLHQTADEVEVALTVLDAIRPCAQRATELGGIDIGAAVVGKHRFDDLQRGLVLEDAAVGAERKMPQPGPQRDAVEIVASDRAAEIDGGDPAVDEPELVVRALDFHRGLGAEQVLRDDRVEALGAHQFEPVGRKPAEFLEGLQAPEHQRVLAEDALEPGFVGDGHGVDKP